MLDAENPHVQKLAEMPDYLFELLEKADPLKAEFVRDCKAAVYQEKIEKK